METLIYCLSGRIAKVQRRAVRYIQQVLLVPVGCIYRNLNIFLYMSRPLGSVRLALHPAQAINQGFPIRHYSLFFWRKISTAMPDCHIAGFIACQFYFDCSKGSVARGV